MEMLTNLQMAAAPKTQDRSLNSAAAAPLARTVATTTEIMGTQTTGEIISTQTEGVLTITKIMVTTGITVIAKEGTIRADTSTTTTLMAASTTTITS